MGVDLWGGVPLTQNRRRVIPPPVDFSLACPHETMDSDSTGVISYLRQLPKPLALSFGIARSPGT